VRFRHLDTDIVRGARQQHYLSAAKDQVGVERLFRDREELLELFGRYTDTDINSSAAILRLLKLTYESSRDPLRRVKFDVELGQEFVTISSASCRRPARSSSAPRRRPAAPARPRSAPSAPGASARAGRASRPASTPRAPRPRTRRSSPRSRCRSRSTTPKAIRRGARYWDGFEGSAPRTYDLFDEQRRKHRAYRMVVEAPGIGEYYGVQGTDWMDPPIIANPSETRTVGGRRLLLFRDGSRLRMVAWKTDNAVYWVTNTLLRSLTNRQMLGIARSLTRVGSSG
jgi:hypothetical protein